MSEIKKRMESILKKAIRHDLSVREIIKLHGDASYRTYYRAILEDGLSFILMQMPEGKASASEEITNFKGELTELPFINIARYLKKIGVNTPEIHHHSKEDNVIVLEDLGDVSLWRLLDGANENMIRVWYKKAIELLADIQLKSADSLPADCVAFNRSFDKALLNWEFDHFLEYGIKISKEDIEIFKSETRKISDEIAGLPYGFTHRDYQSRNIFIVDNAIYLIDFQDALLGPHGYDLVSLIRDSYMKLPPHLVDELCSFYCDKTGKDRRSFQYQFDLITCQRKLKDAGRFVYIDRVKKNSDFLKYIPTSLSYVKEALERLPKYNELYDILKKYIPEWR